MSDTRTPAKETVVRSDQPHRDRGPRFRRRWVLGAIGVVILVAAVVLPDLIARSLASSSAVAVAERYMEARSALDAETAVADFGFDIAITDIPVMEDFGEVVDQFAFLEVIDHELTEYSCTTGAETSQSEPVQVDCQYLFTTNLAEALGVEALTGSITLFVEDGRVVRLFHAFNLTQFDSRVFGVFIDWLEENHPGVVERTWHFPHGRNVMTFKVSDANLAELEQHIAEFEADQSPVRSDSQGEASAGIRRAWDAHGTRWQARGEAFVVEQGDG